MVFFTWRIIPWSYWCEGLVLACLFLCLGCGLVWTNFHKVPQLAAYIASFLSLLIYLIGEDEILNLDGHTLDIELLDHLLHLVDKLDRFFIKVGGGGGRLIIITWIFFIIIIILIFFFIFTWGTWAWACLNLLALHLLFLATCESFAFAWWRSFFFVTPRVFKY